MNYLDRRPVATTEAAREKKTSRSPLSQRKSLRKKAMLRHPNRPMGWVGGILYFLDTKIRVPGVDAVLITGQTAKGWDANQPKGERRSREERRRSSYGRSSSSFKSSASSYSSGW